MKELLRRLAEAERKTTEIDEKWVADPENEELQSYYQDRKAYIQKSKKQMIEDKRLVEIAI